MKCRTLLMVKWLALLSLVCLACSPKTRRVHWSEDRTVGLRLLFDDVAIERYYFPKGWITTTGTTERVVYSLVRAKWSGQPTMRYNTGFEVTHTFVEHIREIGFDERNNIVFGVLNSYNDFMETDKSEETFILHNDNIRKFSSKMEFLLEMKKLSVGPEAMSNPLCLFGVRSLNG